MLILKRFAPVFILLYIFLMLLAAYSNSFYSPPVLDDFHTFVDSTVVRTNPWTIEGIGSLGGTIFSWTRWIPMITFSWDIWYGKGELFFLHLTNFFIHALCLLAIFLMIYEISKRDRQYVESKEHLPHALVLALSVAGLWALHPVQTNAVTYLVQRMASLVTLFYVLSVATYFVGRVIHLQKKSLNIKSVAFYSCSFLCMILAFLSKPNAAILPVMLLFTEAWFFRPDIFRRILHLARKHWILSVVCLLTIFVISANILPAMLIRYETRHFTLIERLLTQARVILWYISVLIYPHPNRLSLEHDVELSTSLLHPLTTFPSIWGLIAITICIFVYRRRFPLITYGILWFLLNLVIESSIIPLELIFEHRIYLPSVGLILAIVATFFNISQSVHWKIPAKDIMKLSWCVVAIMASLLTLATFQRNNAWKDGVTLNEDSARKAPNNPRAHANLGVALLRAQRYEEAIHEANSAITLGIKHFESYSVAANVIMSSYAGLGKYDIGVAEGERLLKEWPKDSDAQAWPSMSLNLASAYLGNHNVKGAYLAICDALVHNSLISIPEPYILDGAIKHLRQILRVAEAEGIELDRDCNVDQSNLSAEMRIAALLLRLGYREKARELLTKSVLADEHSKRLLQTILKDDELNEIQRNKKDFTQKYVYHPFSSFNASMAAAFLSRKMQLPSPLVKIGERLLDYALELKPDSADAHLLKGWYYYERNDFTAAVDEARRALDLEPDHYRAWLGLGIFLIGANQTYEAVAAFQKTLELYPGCPERSRINGLIAGLQEAHKSMATNENVRMN